MNRSISTRSTSALATRTLTLATLAVLTVSAFTPHPAQAAEPALPPRAAPYERVDSHDRTTLDATVPADAAVPARAAQNRAPGDTTFFGYVDANGFAIAGETWTWDHGHPTNPLEGWNGIDVKGQERTFFQRIDAAIWNAPETGNLVPPPILSGAGSAWVGAFELESDTLCWESGLGYGNDWIQRLVSPVFDYTGTGDVTLEFTYFSDSEEGFDYTQVLLRRLPVGNELLVGPGGITGQIGLSTDHPAQPPVGEVMPLTLTETNLIDTAQFQVIFEFESDGGWSDEDAQYETEYGPFAVDDVSISGSVSGGPFTYGFESDLEGWTTETPGGPGPFMIVSDLSNYTILDDCACDLESNVLGLHDTMEEHPDGQRQYAISNAIDLTDVPDPGSGTRQIFARWDQYSILPSANGVFYRGGWSYYPYTCPLTGVVGWSPRVGPNSFAFTGPEPLCASTEAHALDHVPAAAEQVRFIFELYASCFDFEILPGDCSGVTNETPLIDNVRVGVTYEPAAPAIAWDTGFEFVDGFSQGSINDPFDPGNADCYRSQDLFGPPWVLEDAPSVTGPNGVATPWDARLHFRVHREGPGASHPNFAAWEEWKTRTGVGIGPSASFAHGVMDTAEVNGVPMFARDTFVAYYREDDPNNPSPGTDLVDANEILVDNVPPGTQIDYFASAYYQSGPTEVRLLPDTTGGNFRNFEILPTWRDDGGVLRFPAILYIDAHNRGAEFFISSALDELGHPYDIYDHLGGGCCGAAPFARGTGVLDNNGMTLPQLLGYRAVLYNEGDRNSGLRDEDAALLDDWLTAELCGPGRRGLIANGDDAGLTFDQLGQSLMGTRMGASYAAPSYTDASGDDNLCVDLVAASGALYGTTNSINGAYDYGAVGNGCPDTFDFDVLSPVGDGVGNRVYQNATTAVQTSYAEVAREYTSTNNNYRTVIGGVSWHHLTERSGAGGDPECSPTNAQVVTAIKNELAAALEWIFDGSIPGLMDTCEPAVSDVPVGFENAGAVTRLYANQPNPFNPRTTLRFSLARTQLATLAVFDVSGRRVRTLIDAELDGGPHEIVWDGTDDGGRALAAGVYWSQLVTDDFRGSKKMIVLD